MLKKYSVVSFHNSKLLSILLSFWQNINSNLIWKGHSQKGGDAWTRCRTTSPVTLMKELSTAWAPHHQERQKGVQTYSLQGMSAPLETVGTSTQTQGSKFQTLLSGNLENPVGVSHRKKNSSCYSHMFIYCPPCCRQPVNIYETEWTHESCSHHRRSVL